MPYTPEHADWKDFPDTSTPIDQAALEHMETGIVDAHIAIDNHLADASDAHAASEISFTPEGSIAATNVQLAIQEVRDEAAGGGAPSTADYLVGTAQGGLSAEIVVGTSPGGELGGTWAAPTVDATHSGSSHASVQSAAEATAATNLNNHITDATDAHDASAISILDTAADFTATDVEGALAELQTRAEAHLADATDAHDASAVSTVPTGEMVETDAQTALQTLFTRSSVEYNYFVRQRALTVWEDDFLIGGTPNVGDNIGQLSWFVQDTGGTPVAPASSTYLQSHAVSLNPVTNGNYCCISLGTTSFLGANAFHFQWFGNKSILNDGSDAATSRVGLYNDAVGGTPTTGFWWEETSADTTWHVKSADATNGTQDMDTNVTVDGTNHLFELIYDGVNSLIVKIDGTPVSGSPFDVTGKVPQSINRFGPNITNVKTLGSAAARATRVDWWSLSIANTR